QGQGEGQRQGQGQGEGKEVVRGGGVRARESGVPLRAHPSQRRLSGARPAGGEVGSEAGRYDPGVLELAGRGRLAGGSSGGTADVHESFRGGAGGVAEFSWSGGRG